MKEKNDLLVEDVFGQSRKIPLNYVERKGIDKIFVESLSYNQHIVIYGSSKQGKTCLRKYHLDEDKYISIHCSNKWDIGQLNAQILKQAGFKLNVSSSKTINGKSKVTASFNFMSFFKAGGEFEEGNSQTDEYKPLELDIYDSNDIIDALKSIEFNKYIILEDFHYLKEDTQEDFAFELKSFHENSNFTFIIVGVWLEENRLAMLNGDLTGRVYSINVDNWKKSELEEVIINGEKLLNITFNSSLKEEIKKWSVGSVFILQEISLKLCKENGINKKQEVNTEIKITPDIDIFDLTESIINQQTGRYDAFIRAFYHGFQETELQMHRWLLYPILKADTTEQLKGISYRKIKEIIQDKHPKGKNLNPGNITMTLNSVTSLQIKKNIKPNIIDYDQSNKILNIVDRGFIAWLIFQDIDKLLELNDLPKD
jgi:hypothetical protein